MPFFAFFFSNSSKWNNCYCPEAKCYALEIFKIIKNVQESSKSRGGAHIFGTAVQLLSNSEMCKLRLRQGLIVKMTAWYIQCGASFQWIGFSTFVGWIKRFDSGNSVYGYWVIHKKNTQFSTLLTSEALVYIAIEIEDTCAFMPETPSTSKLQRPWMVHLEEFHCIMRSKQGKLE